MFYPNNRFFLFDSKDKINLSFSKSFWKPLSVKQQVFSTIKQVEKLVLASIPWVAAFSTSWFEKQLSKNFSAFKKTFLSKEIKIQMSLDHFKEWINKLKTTRQHTVARSSSFPHRFGGIKASCSTKVKNAIQALPYIYQRSHNHK